MLTGPIGIMVATCEEKTDAAAVLLYEGNLQQANIMHFQSPDLLAWRIQQANIIHFQKPRFATVVCKCLWWFKSPKSNDHDIMTLDSKSRELFTSCLSSVSIWSWFPHQTWVNMLTGDQVISRSTTTSIRTSEIKAIIETGQLSEDRASISPHETIICSGTCPFMVLVVLITYNRGRRTMDEG